MSDGRVLDRGSGIDAPVRGAGAGPSGVARWRSKGRLSCISKLTLRGALLGLASTFALSAPLHGQVTARDTLPLVRRIEIEGNTAFSDERIKEAIATRESGCRSVFLSPFCWIGIGVFKRRVQLSPRELRTDVARIRIFYFRRGYRQVQVDTSLVRQAGEVDVIFQVDEGAPIVVRSLEVHGLDEFPNPNAVLASLPLRVDSTFSEVRISRSREQIEGRLRNRGYAQAAVVFNASVPSEDSLGAYVTVEVVPGARYRFGEIEIEGASELEPRHVRRLLSFRSGDRYNEAEIVRSQRALYSMALFDYVNIAATPSVIDSTVNVRVQVNEAEMRSLQFGSGVSTTDCVEFEAGWTHRNFLGGTRRFELSGGLSNILTSELAQRFPCQQAGEEVTADERVSRAFNQINWRVRADFRQPWFLGTRNTLQLGIFSERQSLPPVYARLSYGGDVQVSRELSPGTVLFTTFRAGRDSLLEGSADFLFCANFGVCNPADIETLSETRWLNWVSFGIARNQADALLNPTRGYRMTLEGEHASKRFTGSDWAYYRAQGEFSWYQRLGSGRVLALRLRGGLARPTGSGIEGVAPDPATDPVSHPLKRHYAGGAYTVRGFGQNLLGPKVLLLTTSNEEQIRNKLPACDLSDVVNNTWPCDPGAAGQTVTAGDFAPRPIGGENSVVANLELRLPLGSNRWSGVVFADVGRVWTDGFLGAAEDFQWSPGIGVRYRSPVGPIRLDIGYNTGGAERLPVVVALSQDGDTEIVQLIRPGSDPERPEPALFDYDPLDDFLSRLQLHFSIGQAF